MTAEKIGGIVTSLFIICAILWLGYLAFTTPAPPRCPFDRNFYESCEEAAVRVNALIKCEKSGGIPVKSSWDGSLANCLYLKQ